MEKISGSTARGGYVSVIGGTCNRVWNPRDKELLAGLMAGNEGKGGMMCGTDYAFLV